MYLRAWCMYCVHHHYTSLHNIHTTHTDTHIHINTHNHTLTTLIHTSNNYTTTYHHPTNTDIHIVTRTYTHTLNTPPPLTLPNTHTHHNSHFFTGVPTHWPVSWSYYFLLINDVIGIQCTVYTIQRTVYTIQCQLYTVRRTLYVSICIRTLLSSCPFTSVDEQWMQRGMTHRRGDSRFELRLLRNWPKASTWIVQAPTACVLELRGKCSIHASYSVHCTVYIVHCTMYSVHCTVYIVHCTLYSVYTGICIFVNVPRMYIRLWHHDICSTKNTCVSTICIVHCTLYDMYVMYKQWTYHEWFHVRHWTSCNGRC